MSTSRRWRGAKKWRQRTGVALLNFSVSNCYQTAVGGGESGASTGFLSAVLCRIDSMESTINPRVAADRFQNGIGGWTNYFNATAATYQGAVHDGSAVVRNTALAPFVMSDVGKILLLCVQLTSSGAFRVFNLRAQQYGADTMVTGYLSANARHVIGNRAESLANLALGGVSVLAHATWRGDLTLAQIQAIYDETRDAGDIPAAFVGAPAPAHRWPPKTALAGSSTIISGQAGPASIADTVTGASLDRMDGTATVRTFDPSAPSRVTYGALGSVNSSAGLIGADGEGLQGDPGGFWFATSWRCDIVAAVNQCIIGAHWPLGTNWMLQAISPGLLRLSIRSNSALAGVSGPNLVSSDVGFTEPLLGNFDGSNFRLYRRRQMIAELTGITYTPYLPGSRILWGQGYAVSQPLEGAVFELIGGNLAGGLADSQVTQVFEAWERYGKLIAPIPPQNAYDITLDVGENGGPSAGFPAVVKNRGSLSGDLSPWGQQIKVERGGITGFGPRYYSNSSVVSGITGIASAIYVEALVCVRPGGEQYIFTNTGNTNKGLSICLLPGTCTVRAQFSGTSAAYDALSPELPTGDYHIAARYDGSVGTLHIDGAIAATTAPFTYVPNTIQSRIGTVYTGLPHRSADALIHFGACGGPFVPTDGEIATASAAAHAAGKIVGVPAKFDRKWSIVDDVIDFGGRVPTFLKERASAQPSFVLTGNRLQLAQRVEHTWSWETTPVLYGMAP